MALKTKELLKNNGCSFVSAFLAGAFFLFACYYFKAYPFDENYCLLYSDLGQQYYPQLVHLYDIIHSGKDVFYSWSSALGYSFLGNLGNVISPFNLIMLLFERDDIAFSITYIVLSKLMVIAYCFSYYLRKIYKQTGIFNIIPSLLYALSGFFVAYYYHIMWLDSLYTLPVLILGFHKLIDEKKPWLYLCAFTYLMVLGAYGAYMFSIFLCLYFIYYYLQKNSIKQDFSDGIFKSKFFKNGLTFAGASVLSALLASFMLLPMFFMLNTTAAAGDSFENGIEFYYSPLQFWAQQFSGSSIAFQPNGTPKVPNCWAGLLCVILIPSYLLSKAFPKKERILDISFLGVMILSLSLNILSFVWCGFHFANGFADRFAFFYVFLAVTVMSKALSNIGKIKRPVILICSACSAAFIVLMRVFNPDGTEKYTLIISLSFIAIWLLVYLISWVKKADKALLKLVVLFVVCMELVFAQLENVNMNGDKRDFERNAQTFSSTLSMTKEAESDLFYRIEACSPQNIMYPFLMNYNGISGFSSVIPQALLKSQRALGANSNNYNCIIYFPNTPVYNSIFGIKYLIGSNSEFPYSSTFRKTIDNESMAAFKNNYYLPLGFCVNSSALEYNSKSRINPFYQQNAFFSSLCGADQVFKCCDCECVSAEKATFEIKEEDVATQTKLYSVKHTDETEDGSITFDYTIPEDGYYFFCISHYAKQNKTEVTLCGEEFGYLKVVGDYYTEPNAVFPIKDCHAGDKLKIKFNLNERTDTEPIAVYLASFNEEAFIEGYNRLSNNTLTLTEFENTHLKGNVTAEKDCLLFTSIPYDKGWHIALDGVCVKDEDIVKIDNAYISIPLTEGAHTVEFNYLPYGLKTGGAISSVSLIALIVATAIKKKRQKKL